MLERVDTVVTGAGGFIGGHLVRALLDQGQRVRAVDRRPFGEWSQLFPSADNQLRDLSLLDEARTALRGATVVYQLASNSVGSRVDTSQETADMLSVLTSTHSLVAAREAGVARFFFASAADVYPGRDAGGPVVVSARESDAYPALPVSGLGWEKLFSERMADRFEDDYGVGIRVARLHGVYGPENTWRSGREGVPAAICRAVAIAAVGGESAVDIRGDGEQTRSYTYIDDCVDGIQLVTRGDDPRPVNLGNAEPVTVNQLVGLVEEIAGVQVARRHLPADPREPRTRVSDNAEILARYGWAPSTGLRAGLERTYAWVLDQVVQSHPGPARPHHTQALPARAIRSRTSHPRTPGARFGDVDADDRGNVATFGRHRARAVRGIAWPPQPGDAA